MLIQRNRHKLQIILFADLQFIIIVQNFSQIKILVLLKLCYPYSATFHSKYSYQVNWPISETQTIYIFFIMLLDCHIHRSYPTTKKNSMNTHNYCCYCPWNLKFKVENLSKRVRRKMLLHDWTWTEKNNAEYLSNHFTY